MSITTWEISSNNNFRNMMMNNKRRFARCLSTDDDLSQSVIHEAETFVVPSRCTTIFQQGQYQCLPSDANEIRSSPQRTITIARRSNQTSSSIGLMCCRRLIFAVKLIWTMLLLAPFSHVDSSKVENVHRDLHLTERCHTMPFISKPYWCKRV